MEVEEADVYIGVHYRDIVFCFGIYRCRSRMGEEFVVESTDSSPACAHGTDML